MSDNHEHTPPPKGFDSEHRACPACGAALDDVQTYCPACGQHVENFFAPRKSVGFTGKSRQIAIIAGVALVLTLICVVAFTIIAGRMSNSISATADPELMMPVPDLEPVPEPDPIDLIAEVPVTNQVVKPVVPVPEPIPTVTPTQEAQRRYEVGLALEAQAADAEDTPDRAATLAQNALREFRAAASSGHMEAMYRMAEMHAKGTGVPVNLKRAAGFYLEAGSGGVRRARDKAAAMFVDGLLDAKGCPDCMEWLQQGAARGSDDAVYALGKAYTQGVLLPKDPEQALYYLREAAQDGRPEAMNDIAYLLLSNDKGLRDLAKAHSFFLRGASLGRPEGLNAFYAWLGRKIVEDMDKREPLHGPDDAMVIRKYTGLVARGTVQSVGSRSVTVIQKGSPVELDFTDIDFNSRTMLDPKFRELVAGLRLHESLAALSDGNIDPLRPAEGRADIQRANGLALKNGSYGVRDYPAAFAWLRTAAHQDDVLAMYYLGEMYYRGYGTDRNQSLALAWMDLAKRAGYAPAATFIQRTWEKQDQFAQMQKMARDALLVERDRHARSLERIGSEPSYDVFFGTKPAAAAP